MKENIFKCPKCNFKSKRNEWYEKTVQNQRFVMFLSGVEETYNIVDICPNCGTIIYNNGTIKEVESNNEM